MAPAHAGTTVRAKGLGIEAAVPEGARMRVGRWYPAKRFDAVHVSVITLAHVAPELLDTFKDRVATLAANNGRPQVKAMAYLVALDLRRYTLGWMHGTAHPGVAWSRRHKLRRTPPECTSCRRPT